VTKKAGLLNNDGKGLAVVLADAEQRGWPDIFIANDTQRNFLYLNNRDGTFRDGSYHKRRGIQRRRQAGAE